MSHNMGMKPIEIIRNYECATFVVRESTYKELLAVLLVSGYGVAQLNPSSKKDGEERVLLVVNLKFDPKFRQKLADLSEYYRQDTFMFSSDGEELPVVTDELAEMLQLDTFDRYSINGKHAIHYYAWQGKVRREKQRRKAVIERAIKKMNGDRVPSFFFLNDDIPNIDYWYDAESDSIATEYASIRFDCETDKIDTGIVCKMLYKLEDLLTDYFKKNFGVELISIDTDD